MLESTWRDRELGSIKQNQVKHTFYDLSPFSIYWNSFVAQNMVYSLFFFNAVGEVFYKVS